VSTLPLPFPEPALEIPLRNRAGEVIAYTVIDGDRADLLAFSWYLIQPNGRQVYAARRGRAGEPKQVYLHREVLGLNPGDGLVGDHIEGNTLDNRRCNLRRATHTENQRNRHAAERGAA
jgi:hypothetical protein